MKISEFRSILRQEIKNVLDEVDDNTPAGLKKRNRDIDKATKIAKNKANSKSETDRKKTQKLHYYAKLISKNKGKK